MNAKILAIFVLVVATASSLSAGIVPGRWEKVEALSLGDPIIVILKTGDHIESTFVGIDPESLRIIGADNRAAQVPRQEVSRVEGKVDDGVTNGVLLDPSSSLLPRASIKRNIRLVLGLESSERQLAD